MAAAWRSAERARSTSTANPCDRVASRRSRRRQPQGHGRSKACRPTASTPCRRPWMATIVCSAATAAVGQIMTAVALLTTVANDARYRRPHVGQHCRCGTTCACREALEARRATRLRSFVTLRLADGRDRRDARAHGFAVEVDRAQLRTAPCRQPYLVPVRPSRVRTTHNSGMSGVASTSLIEPFTSSFTALTNRTLSCFRQARCARRFGWYTGTNERARADRS